MSTLLKTLFPCLPLAQEPSGSIRLPTTPTSPATYHPLISEKPALQSPPHGTKNPKLTTSSAATSIVSALLSASARGPPLTSEIQSLVHQAGGWSEYLATKILSALEAVLKATGDDDEGKMNGAMREAYGKACEAARVFEGFAKEHPVAVGVFVTVVAIGVVVLLAPEVLEWLGFVEWGIVEGSWAARWQATYMGLVPKGSLFSFFQRLGMTTWRWV